MGNLPNDANSILISARMHRAAARVDAAHLPSKSMCRRRMPRRTCENRDIKFDD